MYWGFLVVPLLSPLHLVAAKKNPRFVHRLVGRRAPRLFAGSQLTLISFFHLFFLLSLFLSVFLSLSFSFFLTFLLSFFLSFFLSSFFFLSVFPFTDLRCYLVILLGHAPL